MTFRDLLDTDRLLLVVCHDCNGRTPLDPAPLALRLGVVADVATLKHDMTCPVCGSADVTLAAFSPVQGRKATELA